MARLLTCIAFSVLVLGGCDEVLQLVLRPEPPPDAAPTYVQEVLADQPLAYFRLGELSGITAVNSVVDGPEGTYAWACGSA